MGFAAEIKEFLGAAKDSWKLMSDTELKDAQAKYTNTKAAAEQKEMDDPLNQQLKEAKLAHTRATTANIGRETPLQALQRKALQLEMDARANPPPNPVVGAIGDTARPPVSSNIPAPPQQNDEDLIGPPVPKLRRYKSGGLVQKFAIGGVVDDEDLAPDDEGNDGGALPQQAIPTRGIGTPAPPQRGGALTPTPRARPAEADFNPISDGLKYGASQIAQAPAIGSARQRAVRGYAQGAGAAPVDDMIQIYRKIDPTGKKYTESERNLVALNAVYQFKLNQGGPNAQQAAAQTAFQMLQHFNVAQTRYGALAAAAMQGGHVDDGIKLALKQYANIPDGNDLKMWRDEESGRIGWSLMTKDGKKSGGVATPEEIGSAAMGLATPGGFQNHLVQAMSGAKIGGKTMGGGAGGKGGEDLDETPGPMKDPAKHEALVTRVGAHVDAWDAANKKSPGYKEENAPDKRELTATKNMLYHVARNNDFTDDEGLRRIQSFITDPEDASQPGFKVFKDPDTKMRIIQFRDGATMKVPESAYSTFRAERTNHFKEEADRARKEYEAANKPSGLAQADEAFNKSALETGEAVKGFVKGIPEAVSKSTVGAIGRGAGSVVDEASKWLGKAGQTIKEEGGAGAIGKAVGALGPAADDAQKYLRENPEATP